MLAMNLLLCFRTHRTVIKIRLFSNYGFTQWPDNGEGAGCLLHTLLRLHTVSFDVNCYAEAVNTFFIVFGLPHKQN